jgi:integrase
LHLDVKPSGARSWILRVTVGDRRREIGLGGYPTVTLEQARVRARETRERVWQGVDPVAAKQSAQDALRVAQAKRLTFDEAAAACHKAKSREFKSVKHSRQWKSTLDLYASPIIGSLPVDQVELAHVVNVLNQRVGDEDSDTLWLKKTESASRIRQRIEAVLSWAAVSGYRTGENPAAWKGNLEFVLPKPTKVRKRTHHAAIAWQEIGAFMTALRKREGLGARALEFAILTAARSGEVRLATWDEIDLRAKVWTVPAERMKAGKIHRVPLSDPAIKLLKALPRFEGSPYVFPAPRGGAFSDMALSAVTKRMAVNAVPHGFRSTFKDWARSSTSYPDEVSELALAHVNSDETRAAYARDELLPKRAKLMRDWANFCSTPMRPGKVVRLHR